MTDPADLISAAIASIFGGDTPTLRTSYDRWDQDRNAQYAEDFQRRPLMLVQNESSYRLGANAQQKYVAVIESPVLYVGIADTTPDFGSGPSVQKFIPRNTDVLVEARYGVDRTMREATPFMSNFTNSQQDLFTLDSFPIDGVLKNWQTTAPSSFRLSTSAQDALAARAVPASNNMTKIYEQKELAEVVGPYKSHPQESKLREIRYITVDVIADVIYGTGTTTEQRRRLPKTGYQGANYTAETTEDAGLFTISRTTGLATFVASYNGSDWDDALLKQIHLVAHHEGLGTLYGIMPPGSHQTFLDTAEANGDIHIGTLVTINKTTAEVIIVGGLYWTPGTDGYASVELKSFTYSQFESRLLVVVRKDDGAAVPAVGNSIYVLDEGLIALTTEVYDFGSITYSNESARRGGRNIRAIANRGAAGHFYVLSSWGIGEMQNPRRFLHALNTATGTETLIGIVRQTSVDSFFFRNDSFYGVDADTHELVQIHESFETPGVFQRDMGALVVNVFDTGATDQIVYTRLNADNGRALDYYDLMVVTLESDRIGELLQIEFGSANSKIDDRSPVLMQPGRQPDIQIQKVQFREADKQVDVYINIKGSTFGGSTRDEMRYIGFRVNEARSPFTFKVNRIQLMKLNPDQAYHMVTPEIFLENNKQFVQFSAVDRRRVRWFVQFRIILITRVPPISPRVKDALEHIDNAVTVLNHPHRRLRGGRAVTPHLNDPTLLFGSAGWSQTPAKIPGALVADGYGVDPASEPIQDPLLFFG